MDIASFVVAQLDAEAETARAASTRSAEWGADAPFSGRWGVPDPDPEVIAGGKPILREDTEYSGHFAVDHVARQDPQATLDRVEATKLLVAMHGPDGIPSSSVCRACADERNDWPCPTLRALAYAYRRQPGWEPGWAPDGVTSDA